MSPTSLQERLNDPAVIELVAKVLEAPGGSTSSVSVPEAIARTRQLSGDPAWAELESSNCRAQAVLEWAAPLGPAHATLAPRYNLLAPALLILVLGGSTTDPAEALTLYGQRLLATAATNSWQEPVNFLSVKRDRICLGRADLVAEGSGSVRRSHRLLRRRLTADLRDLAIRAWTILGVDPDRLPALVFRRPGDDLNVDQIGQFVRDEYLGDQIFLNAERATLAAIVRNHRLLDGDLPDDDISRYEPCAFLAPRLCADPPGAVLLHEIIHAAVPVSRGPYEPAGRHAFCAAGIERAARKMKPAGTVGEVSIAGALITVRQQDTGPSRPEDWVPVRGSMLLDEALTEALTLELTPALTAGMPDLFVAPTRLWAGHLAPVGGSYDEGVRFLGALLGPGVSVKPYLFGPDRSGAFLRILRERLSAPVASELESSIFASQGAGLRDGSLAPELISQRIQTDLAEDELVLGCWHALVKRDRADPRGPGRQP